jgi:hypothetical protein
MRSLPGGTRRPWSDGLILPVAAAALGCLGLGCAPQFLGPYACLDGYASCINPSANECETNLTTDALNCGACGMACGVGAACANSMCGMPAQQLAPLSGLTGQQNTLEVNSSAVFWLDNQNGQPPAIHSVPIGGGSPATVAMDLFCQSPRTFAVDDANVYYVSAGNGLGGGPDLVEVPLVGGATTVLASSGNGGGSCPVLAVDQTNLYALTQVAQGGPSVSELVEVPIAGGAPTTLATSSTYSPNALGLTPTDAIVQVTNNSGPASFAAIPLAGGSPVPLPASGDEGGPFGFVADATNIYSVGSFCPCNGNGPSYDGPPNGQVVMQPIGGGAQTVLARFTGAASSIAVDSDSVYWSTDTAVWKVPIAGGPALPVAGSLTSMSNGASGAGYQCTGCGGGSPASVTTLIAVDATSIYIADFAPDVDAILKVPK